MDVWPKPRVEPARIAAFLHETFGEVSALSPLAEGEDSQVFRFDLEGRSLVVRLNWTQSGFRKDAYAAQHFASRAIPVPPVVRIGEMPDGPFYCVSEFVAAPTFQDLDPSTSRATLPAVLALQQAIRRVDVKPDAGFGTFDVTGRAAFRSWPEWLLHHTEGPGFDWGPAMQSGLVPEPLLRAAFLAFRHLVDLVPNEHTLYHGDFGSNNLLVRDARIAAVLDWDEAGYGDWLLDVAGACYWRRHLPAMDQAARYYDERLGNLPGYRTRILCYQFRAALVEIYAQWRRRSRWLPWHVARLEELVRAHRDR